MAKVGDHVQKKHAVHTSTDTINNFVRGKVRQT
ncbi:MAG: hypothetical protein M3396_04750 [Actinomycetota bacterium]|nr:hypothetical protein [Actinomycetota bacterium]